LENNNNVLETIFPHRIKALRTARLLKLRHVAEGSGLHISTIGNYEAAQKTPSLEGVMSLAKFYGVSMDFLTGFDFEMENDIGIKICKKIRELRLEVGYSEKEFAKLVNMQINDYMNIEFGKLPDMETLKSIAFYTMKKLKDLTGFSEEELTAMYKRKKVVDFAKDERNLKYMELAMKLKDRELDPDKIILGVKI